MSYETYSPVLALSTSQVEKLPFPEEVLNADFNRGLELTSIKADYVL